jgi:di/tricarboxylate transporter
MSRADHDLAHAPRPLPRATGYVALAMIVLGILAVAAGTIGVSDPSTGRALAAAAVMVTGAAFVLVGWRLRRHERRAYVAAIVLLTGLGGVWLFRALVDREAWFVGQIFGPVLGIWLLLRPESREHFAP